LARRGEHCDAGETGKAPEKQTDNPPAQDPSTEKPENKPENKPEHKPGSNGSQEKKDGEAGA
ncbi:MAG: hypothetical protein L0K56_03055, partial [Corynebacterium sp.]|nr:hypothetical protein [Corynebacterium sp.]